MTSRLYNNFGICSLGIAFTVNEFDGPMPVSKALLIAPLISSRRLLDHLARKNAVVTSIEKLLVRQTSCFANFNDRFYDALCESINAIQFLLDVEVIEIQEKQLQLLAALDYDPAMGKRAQKLYLASSNLAKILSASNADLYSSLRVQL